MSRMRLALPRLLWPPRTGFLDGLDIAVTVPATVRFVVSKEQNLVLSDDATVVSGSTKGTRDKRELSEVQAMHKVQVADPSLVPKRYELLGNARPCRRPVQNACGILAM